MAKNPDHYHKREHARALKGMERLSMEQRGCYQTLLDLIYLYGGPLADVSDDDATWFASKMNCSRRKWRSVRDELLAKGRIWRDDEGFLHDDECDRVLAEREQERAENVANGSIGGKKSAENRAKISRTRDENSTKTPRKPDEREQKHKKTKEAKQAPLGFSIKPNASLLELELELEEEGGGGNARTRDKTPFASANAVLAAVQHPLLDPAKAAGLVSGGREVDRWIEAGADLQTVVIPTISAVMQTYNPNNGPVGSWTYFTKRVRANAGAALAPNPKIEPLKEAPNVRSNLPASGANRRGVVSRTDAAMQLATDYAQSVANERDAEPVVGAPAHRRISGRGAA